MALSAGKPVCLAFPSVRAKKRFLFGHRYRRRNSFGRLAGRRGAQSKRQRALYPLRTLIVPSLAGRYAIVLLVRHRYPEPDVNDEQLIAMLRSLIPGRFKVTYRTNARRAYATRARNSQGTLSVINRIYLTHEVDLCVVMLAFRTRLWQVMRVAAPSPDPVETAPSGVAAG